MFSQWIIDFAFATRMNITYEMYQTNLSFYYMHSMNRHRLYKEYLKFRVFIQLPTIRSFPFSSNYGELEGLTLIFSEMTLI